MISTLLILVISVTNVNSSDLMLIFPARSLPNELTDLTLAISGYPILFPFLAIPLAWMVTDSKSSSLEHNGSKEIEEPSYERVDTETLGRATWTFLHTFAASFPSNPSVKEKVQAERFMRDFADIYPCAPCAASFREILKKEPPRAEGGGGFAQWMCKVHNMVNEEIGKEQFDCSKVAGRWGVCDSCQDHADELEQFKRITKIKFPTHSHLRKK